MATPNRQSDEIDRLRTENKRLRAELKRIELLDRKDNPGPRAGRSLGRQSGVFIFSMLAVLLLFAGNIMFWTGNTIVKTDRYVDAVEPLIREEAVQQGISSYATKQFFQNVDVEQIVGESLPPRAAFLAPTLSGQVEQNAQNVITNILKNPNFQEKWNTVQTNAHARFINQVSQHGSDGSIDLSELYRDQISPQLKETKLAFLADKPLPDKVGSVKVAEGRWLANLETLINNIDTWRTIAIILLLIFSAAAIWLSRRRRKTVIWLGILFAAAMFVTLIAVRLARSMVAGKADVQYSDAAEQVTRTLLYPLTVQTTTLLALGLLIAFIAWISGPSRSARRASGFFQELFSGRLHSALFKTENGFTIWVGRNKAILQWGAVVIVSAILLLIRITPKALLLSALVALIFVLLIESLAAKEQNSYG